ncbi:MAG: hypothetical protein LBM02_02190, partial [Lachnospiraceae bacterium]|nr:hypothetical protein [Lachnospiraceae bacterium]
GIDFYFDDNGLRNIEISNGLAIEILDYSYEKGTITKIAVRVGDGTEFAKNIYTLKNMNHPKAFYFGSNAQQIDKRIHENISNKEIIQIVRRGEAPAK